MDVAAKPSETAEAWRLMSTKVEIFRFEQP